jgi:hypothetical protein
MILSSSAAPTGLRSAGFRMAISDRRWRAEYPLSPMTAAWNALDVSVTLPGL